MRLGGWAFVLLAGTVVALAKPPNEADPALRPWFQSLKQPGTGVSCCDLTDCRIVHATIKKGHWVVDMKDQEIIVPDDKILRTDNPTGESVLCWSPANGVLCFVEPYGT